MSTVDAPPCSICVAPSCANFLARSTNPNEPAYSQCWCGHPRASHHELPVFQFPPRGSHEGSQCSAFRTQDGLPITGYHQLCRCNTPYSAHGQTLNGPDFSSSAAPIGMHPPSSQPSHLPPHHVPPSSMSMPPPMSQGYPSLPHPNPFSQPHPDPPLSQQPPPITPYQPAYNSQAGSSSSTANNPFYGVTSAPGPPTNTSGRRGRKSKKRQSTGNANGNGTAGIVHRERNLTFDLMVLVLPCDSNKDIPPADPHSMIENIEYLPNGREKLALAFEFLESQGLASVVRLTCTGSDQNLLDGVLTHVNSMMATGPWIFPAVPPPPPLNLSQNATDRELRTIFHNLPFRVLKLGYNTTKGPSIQLDTNASYESFQYGNMKTRFRRPVTKHPTDKTIDGCLYICPKAGMQLRGPVNNNRQEIHDCYSDHILAGIAKSNYRLQEGRSLEEQEHEWREDYFYSCRQSCPGQEVAQVPPAQNPLTHDLSNVHTTPEPAPTTPTLDTTALPIIATQPVITEAGAIHPPFATFQQMDRHITSKRDPGPENLQSFSVRATSVADAAIGLVSAIKGMNRSNVAPFYVQPDSLDLPRFSVHPATATLRNTFSFSYWTCIAGHENHQDAVGSGVLRQMLHEAIQHCLANLGGVMEDSNNDDGYLTLLVSNDYRSHESLQLIFTLGVLCSIFMIKTSNGPDPISPALIQAAIGGIDSILDDDWLLMNHPGISHTLRLLPKDEETPIPDDPALRRLFESRLTNCQFNHILQSQPFERTTLVQSLYINTLLGSSKLILESSAEFKAFQAGLDLEISTAIPSFSNLVAPSLKALLSQSYNRRITSGEQLVPLIAYEIRCTNESTLTTTERLLPKIRKLLERYLVGRGLPFESEWEGRVLTEVVERARRDVAYRARRFVKVLSGLDLLPAQRRRFQIILTENIPPAMLFEGQYNPDIDLIPALTHACTYQMNIWLNPPFIAMVESSDELRAAGDTPFDRHIHHAFVELGDDIFNA